LKSYNIYKELTGNTYTYIENQINSCVESKSAKKVAGTNTPSQDTESQHSKKDFMDNSYCRANKNRYVAWNIAGAGYPWNLVTGVEFRGGGIVGVGLYGEVGMDYTTIEYSYYSYSDRYSDKTLKTAFRYAGGVRFYPYKGLFLDCGYGTIAKSFVDGVSVGSSNSSDRENNAKKAVENSHGILFHAGYNLVTDLSCDAGFFLGLSGGASYDVVNKVFAPSINLKIGVAWGWEK